MRKSWTCCKVLPCRYSKIKNNSENKNIKTPNSNWNWNTKRNLGCQEVLKRETKIFPKLQWKCNHFKWLCRNNFNLDINVGKMKENKSVLSKYLTVNIVQKLEKVQRILSQIPKILVSNEYKQNFKLADRVNLRTKYLENTN